MGERAHVVVIGGGFGGVHAALELERRLPPEAAEITVVNLENFMLFTPLLPEVAAGTLQPRHIGVPLRRILRRSRVVVGAVVAADPDAHTLTVRPSEGPERELRWDRLVLSPGSVSRQLPIPGLGRYAYGLKTLAEAVQIRNHVLRQLELADAAGDAAERRARCTFVVVGAGYAGTELAAEMAALVDHALPNYPRLHANDLRWMLVDIAPRVLPELGDELGTRALKILRGRGVELRLGTGVQEVTAEHVRLSDGEVVATRTLVWTAGVAPDPLVAKLGFPVDDRGKLVVDDHTRVQGRGDVFAIGDAAAVPDPKRPGRPSPPTAQYAVRQGATCGRNVAASLGVGTSVPFRHRDLGLLVSLGPGKAVGRVFGVPLTGFPAWVVTRGYHFLALPTFGRKLRVLSDWLVAPITPPDIAELGSLGRAGTLDSER